MTGAREGAKVVGLGEGDWVGEGKVGDREGACVVGGVGEVEGDRLGDRVVGYIEGEDVVGSRVGLLVGL